MIISDYMKRNVFSINRNSTIFEAAEIVVTRHIGLLPVLDDSEKLIGVVGLKDLLALDMPAFFELVSDVDFIHDFGAVETERPSRAQVDQPVTAIMQPAHFLMAEALLSNTGGVSTLVGVPPNVLIASAAGFSFNDFLVHALPTVFLAWIVVLFMLSFLFRVELGDRPKNIEALLQLNPAESLDDWGSARRVLIVLGGTIALFFLQEILEVSAAFIALSAAAAALILIRPDIRQLLGRIEWSILLFFGALFVIVGGVEASGALEGIAFSLV